MEEILQIEKKKHVNNLTMQINDSKFQNESA